MHFRLHHTEDGRPSDCSECGKTFKNYTRLKEHIKGVHNAKRYQCEQCGKTFQQKSQLSDHEHAHLGPGAGYLHHCNYCEIKVNYKRNLAAHIQKTHPKEWEENIKHRLKEMYGDDLLPKTLEGNRDTSLGRFFNQSGLSPGDQ